MILKINTIDNKDWIDFINQFENVTIFHHPTWHKVLNTQYKFNVFAFCYVEDNKIIAGIPFCEVRTFSGKKKWISLPFSDECEPLYFSEDKLKLLIDYIAEEKEIQQIFSIEIRNKLPFCSLFSEKLNFVVHETKLTLNTTELFKTFKKTQVQNSILKSKRNGLVSEIRDDIGALKVFYKLHLQTRKMHGIPIQPFTYFNKLYDEIISKGIGFVVLIRSDNKYISAGVFFGVNKILTYKYGASNKIFLNLCPNNLMIWSAMSEGIKRGFNIMDFGKSNSQNFGLRKFKSGWGSTERNLVYSYYPEIKNKFVENIIINNILKKIVKNSPPFVGKLIGEMAYIYSA